MPDNSEIIPYDEAGIPLYVQYKYLSAYLNSRALCHWHEDMEFSYVKKGRMNYYVNGKNILLRENDCIMVTARQMHYNYSVSNEECEYFGFIFHSSLLTPNKNLYTKYVSPIVENSQFEYQVFNPSDETGRKVLYYLDCILEKKQQATPGYEIEIIGLAHLLWITIYIHCQKIFHDDSLPISSDLSIQKDMFSYIYQHYADKLTLDDIAASGSVCRSKCCSLFKRYLQQSPIDFLNAYRLEVSCYLLKNTTESITQIALNCGFNHLSYYSKLFLRKYGCTPGEFRKADIPTSTH